MTMLSPILSELGIATAMRSALLPTILSPSQSSANDTLTEWATSLEAGLPGLAQSLSACVADIQKTSNNPSIVAIGVGWLADLLLQVEQGLASALELFRASEIARQPFGTDLAALADRVDAALVQACEALRDCRWELLALRADALQATDQPPLSLADLQADLGLA